MNFLTFYPLISFTIMHVSYLTTQESKFLYLIPPTIVMFGASYAKYLKVDKLKTDYRMINSSKRIKALKGFSKVVFYNTLVCQIEEGIMILTIIGMMTLRGLGERCLEIFYFYLFLYCITLIKMFGKLNKFSHFLKFLNVTLIFFYSRLVKIIYVGRIVDNSIMNGILALIIIVRLIDVLTCTVILVVKKRKLHHIRIQVRQLSKIKLK